MGFIGSELIGIIAEKLGVSFLAKKQLEHSKNLDSHHKAVEALYLPTIEALGEYKKKKVEELVTSGGLTIEQAELIAVNEIQNLTNSLKRQSNIQSAFLQSIKFVEQIENQNKEGILSMPDEDWLREWASNAGKFSKESAQKLWGAVLAGRMNNNDSFSFQTMDILRNMSDADANLFIKFCSIQIASSVITESDVWQDFLSWTDIFHLSDLGLIDSNCVTTTISFDHEEFAVSNLESSRMTSYNAMNNNLLFIYHSELDEFFNQQTCFRLKQPGKELLQLALKVGDDIETNIEYLKKLGKAMRNRAGKEKCGFVITNLENKVIFNCGVDINPISGEYFIFPK